MKINKLAGLQSSRLEIFTLIELLTVIAVIAILMSLLFPALKTVQSQSRQISCASNQKQLAICTSFYLHDNNGYFPMDYRTGPPYDTTYWLQGLISYSSSTAFKYKTAVCSNFDANKMIATTGNDLEKFNSYYVFAAGGTYARYGYNHRTLGCLANAPGFGCNASVVSCNSSKIKKPSDLIELTDCSYVFMIPPSLSSGGSLYWNNYLVLIHNKSINVLFTDGHVSGALRSSDYFTDVTYNTGWINQ